MKNIEHIPMKPSKLPAKGGVSRSGFIPRKRSKLRGMRPERAITAKTIKKLKFNARGLIPAIVQDYKTKDVLMLAYMNPNSLRKTLKEGRTCFWSRSRKEYWVKGMTSGHFQYVKGIYYDCDCDTLLIKVRQVGSACHTLKKSCFYRKIKV